MANPKANELESTGWVYPSVRTYLTPTTGYPVFGPFFVASWKAFSIAGIYSWGIF